VFGRIFAKVLQQYRPSVLVVQCGADCLAQDKLGYSNLTPHSLEFCVRQIMESQLPTIFLGGGN